MKNSKLVVLLFAFTLSLISESKACTAFILKNGEKFVAGRNYDYQSNLGVLMINPKNVLKTAIPFPGEVSATWTSKYGSVTFNAIAREEPIEGINEEGLMIAGLAEETKTKYPEPDNRPAIDNIQWIQYVLDNFATVEEVISSIEKVRISNQSTAKLHYMLCDASGNYAVIEFIDGEFRYYLNDPATCSFISNDSFEKSAMDLKKYECKGGEIPTITSFEKYSPEEAVVIGANMIDNYDKITSLESYAFEILAKVQAPRNTPNHESYGSQWSVVYDCKNKNISFITLDNKEKRVIELNKIDFQCNQSIKAISVVDSKAENIYSQFHVFSMEDNLKMMNKALCIFMGTETLPPFLMKEIEMAAKFPYSYKCYNE